jgi:hypothetical protein
LGGLEVNINLVPEDDEDHPEQEIGEHDVWSDKKRMNAKRLKSLDLVVM